MATGPVITVAQPSARPRALAGTTEPRLVRWVLTALAVGFLVLFVILPAANVFAQALAKGWGAYKAVLSPDVDQARVEELRAKIKDGTTPLRERRKLSRELSDILTPVERAKKTWGAIRMTIGIAAVVVPLNLVFGIAAAWAIAKFRFKGRSLLVSLIDLPFSVSPVVAGLVFVLLFGRTGLLGKWAVDFEWSGPAWRGFSAEHWWPLASTSYTGVIFTPLAIVLASVFVTFPFVARALIPLMESQGTDEEMAALSLGASGWRTFWRVTLPNIKWGLLYGVILCTARAVGEFGAVSVVSGNTESNDTMPLRVEALWQAYDNQAAFTVASLLASIAVVTLVLKSILEFKTRDEAQDRAQGVRAG
jgi:sulfate/thiosulfate transport system permease protein